ncbi:MAG: Mur ligase family protein [Candidatus Magasanikiibacteriota bacterium]
MNYSQALKFLLSFSKLKRKEYLKNPEHCELYLRRLQFFLDLIGNPEKQIPHYIHVTGTSGKGSVCLILDSILRSAKHKVGTLTSPDIGLIQTRWQINGKSMNKNEFAKIITILKPKLDEYSKISPYDPISYFEFLTAVGFYYFAKHKVNWCVLEVGLGGRYDSTNVIPYKDVAVITNIGLDHTQILGNTKTKIAYEKSGIIKPKCKVFTGEKNKKVLDIINAECKKQKVYLEIPDSRFQIPEYKSQIPNLQSFKYKNTEYKIPVLGQHQINNAILAIEIAKYLKISDKQIKIGLAKIKLPLRMEIVSQKPLIILDGAHNPDKMKTTVDTLKYLIIRATEHQSKNYNIKTETCNLHLIIGFSADKNINKMIGQLVKLKPQTIVCTRYTTNPFRETAKPEHLVKVFKQLLPNSNIKYFSKPNQALLWSKKQAKNTDIILSTGSIFLSGELRPKLG